MCWKLLKSANLIIDRLNYLLLFKGKAACLSSSEGAITLVGQEKYGVETYSYRFDGANGRNPSIFFREKRVLDGFNDEYGGVVVNPEKLPFNTNVFASTLRSSLSIWRREVKFISVPFHPKSNFYSNFSAYVFWLQCLLILIAG